MPRLGGKCFYEYRIAFGGFHLGLRCRAQAFSFLSCDHGCMPFFLILAAFDSSGNPWQGFALWTAFAMAAYIVGLTYVAKRESTGGAIAIWPCLFIAAPIGLSFLLNNGRFFWMGVLASLILLAWVVWCLQFVLRSRNVQIFKTVSGLLAGIPLVDMISIVGADPIWMGVMVVLFMTALFFQKFIPAT
jgi:hypothetical protein